MHRSDNILRPRLGRLQRDTTLLNSRRDTARPSYVERIHTQATDHCEKLRRGRIVCCGIGSVRVKENRVDDV